MLIKWGSIVVDGSGKLGGHIFSKSRGGNTVRTLVRATNPQTTFQQVIRSRFTQLSQGWRDLSESERESWYTAESSFSRTNRFGDVVLLSGKNLYNSLNAQRSIIGLGVIDLAPLPTEIPKNIVKGVRILNGAGQIEILGNFNPSTDYVIVASPGLSQGIRNGNDSLRVIVVSETNAIGNRFDVVTAIYDSYVDKFGVPNVGSKIFVGTYSISVSGQRSPVSTVIATFV